MKPWKWYIARLERENRRLRRELHDTQATNVTLWKRATSAEARVKRLAHRG